ncbi:MAG: TonB family protein [Aquificae bacterium]|nr:TonB family protein [Aquificota bacterium]
MESFPTEKSYINKKILIISLLLSVVVNFVFLFAFALMVSLPKDLQTQKPKETKIKYITVKQPKKKKTIKKRKKIQKVKKKRKPSKRKVVSKGSKQATAKKNTGKSSGKRASLPSATPVLPELEIPSEKEIALPEREVDLGDMVDIPEDTGQIKDFKATSPGEFSISFGSELSKIDKTATGTATGRKLVYKPPPPTVKTSVPPPPVKVKLWIRKDGTVSRVQLLGTTGNQQIDQRIREYVLSWKFNEIPQDEEQWATTTVKFETRK